MILRIPTPTSAWGEEVLNLSGLRYRFIFRFNDKDEAWRLSIYRNQDVVIINEKLVVGQPVRMSTQIELFSHGVLCVKKIKETTENLGRNNFGLDKDYELVYYSIEEFV